MLASGPILYSKLRHSVARRVQDDAIEEVEWLEVYVPSAAGPPGWRHPEPRGDQLLTIQGILITKPALPIPLVKTIGAASDLQYEGRTN